MPPSHSQQVAEIRSKLVDKLAGESAASREQIKAVFDELIIEMGLLLNDAELGRLFEQVVADQAPERWELILRDAEFQEIVVIGHQEVYGQRFGAERLERIEVPVFNDENHFLQVINKLLAMANSAVNADNPFAQVQTPDGSHLRAVLDTQGAGRSLLLIRKPERAVNEDTDTVPRPNFSLLRKQG